MNSKKIIVTGITGQDGSYMAEYLLKLGHTVYGMVRRTSQINDKNFKHLRDNPNLILVRGDLSDGSSINTLVQDINPDYFINFAAQSFVGDSWNIPEETFMACAVGVLKCLEAVRKYAPHCRFYNAGSSEQFGDVIVTPQDETHPFRPRSPYGAAKASAHYLVKVYRESYNLYAVQGLLFNHECLTASTPVILKNKNSHLIDILPISEIVPHRKDPTKAKKYTSVNPCEWLVWDGNKWSEIKTRTATWNDRNNDKEIIRVQCRGGYYEATSNHKSFLHGEKEIPTRELKQNDKLELKVLPPVVHGSSVSLEEAELLGYLTSEGYIDNGTGRFTNKDNKLCERVSYLWKVLSTGYTSVYLSKSGFTGKNDIHNVNLLGDSLLCKSLRKQLYTEDGFKKVPQRILNSCPNTIKKYLQAYNQGDGTKAGGQKTEFKCFTTNSSVLAAGLWYLLDSLGFRVISCPEERGDIVYFRLNINSDNKNKGKKGKHLLKDIREITNLSRVNYEGWLFDLETDSKTFSAGVGLTWVHNSERRGEEFVTRKITKGFARIVKSIQNGHEFEPIRLGNVDSKRDWSHAFDFMDAIWRILNQEKYNQQLLNDRTGAERHLSIATDIKALSSHIKEYVVASGVEYTIREFIKVITNSLDYDVEWSGQGESEKLKLNDSFASKFGLKSKDLVIIDSKFYRPADVNSLCGDSSLIRKELGWSPAITFEEMVKRMLGNDLKEIGVTYL